MADCHPHRLLGSWKPYPRGMNGGEAVIALLEEAGIEVAFGIPGVHTLELYRGLAASGVRAVLVRHEQGASFAADGYARATGRPALCCIITGPGLTNAATGVGQAYSDSVPMLVLASVNQTTTLGKGYGDLHELTDQLALARVLTGSAQSVRSVADIPGAVARALAELASKRPRPVYIEIPIDVLEQTVDERWTIPDPPARPRHDPAAVARAAVALAAAQRPVVIVGGGAVAASEAVRVLVARLGAVVLSTTAGKGVVAESDPLCAGALLAYPEAQRFLASRDCALVLGSELAETDCDVNRLALPETLIRVDIDPAKLADAYPATVPVLGDVGPFVAELVEQIAPRAADHAAVSELRAEVEAARGPLSQQHTRVLDAIRAALPADGRVYSDMTQIAYTAVGALRFDHPRRFLHPSGFGTLGYALPAAIGGLLGDPGTATAALIGDAGLLFTVSELATAVQLELPLVVLLWNNDALGQIHGDMIARSIPEISVLPRNPDYPMLARAFGAEAETPASLAEIGPAIARALARNGPTVIELRQDTLT